MCIRDRHEVEHHLAHDPSRRVSQGENALMLVAHEHADNIQQTTNTLAQLADEHAELVEGFQRTYVHERLLRKQQKMIDHMKHCGELLDLDANALSAEIDSELALSNTVSYKMRDMMRLKGVQQRRATMQVPAESFRERTIGRFSQLYSRPSNELKNMIKGVQSKIKVAGSFVAGGGAEAVAPAPMQPVVVTATPVGDGNTTPGRTRVEAPAEA